MFDTPGLRPLTVPAGVAARAGTTPRNYLGGPGYNNLDLSLFKNFAFSERATLQFRAEAFNLTNTPQFANPDRALPTRTLVP